MRQQLIRPIIHNSGNQRFHTAKFRIHTQNQKHGEEQNGPNEASRQAQNQFRISQENQSRSGSGYIVNSHTLQVRHVSQAGENQNASGQAGAGVNDAGDHGIPRKKS